MSLNEEMDANYSLEVAKIIKRVSPDLLEIYEYVYAEKYCYDLLQILLVVDENKLNDMFYRMEKIISDFNACQTKN